MARQSRGTMGSDGYKELEMRQELSKRKKDDSSAVLEAGRKRPKNKELNKLRKEEEKKKRRDPRAAKYIVPRGSGKKITGVRR